MVASGLGNHNGACANAKGRACVCTGCGGSQHGYGGWLDLAVSEPERRVERRQKVKADWRRLFRRRERGRTPAKAREPAVDLARLDIVEWLARSPAGDRPPRSVRKDRTFDSSTEPVTSDTPPDEPSSGDPGRLPAAEHAAVVGEVAKVLIGSIWDGLVADLTRDVGVDEAKKISRDLANHGWCDLLVGLIQAIEAYRSVLDIPPRWAKKIMARALRGSSRRSRRQHLTDIVIDLVVDRVWAALIAAVASGSGSVLAALSNEQLLRCLRILAVFICPAPERHPELRQHALKPLGDDGQEVISAEAKSHLAEMFREWASERSAAASAERA